MGTAKSDAEGEHLKCQEVYWLAERHASLKKLKSLASTVIKLTDIRRGLWPSIDRDNNANEEHKSYASVQKARQDVVDKLAFMKRQFDKTQIQSVKTVDALRALTKDEAWNEHLDRLLEADSADLKGLTHIHTLSDLSTAIDLLPLSDKEKEEAEDLARHLAQLELTATPSVIKKRLPSEEDREERQKFELEENNESNASDDSEGQGELAKVEEPQVSSTHSASFDDDTAGEWTVHMTKRDLRKFRKLNPSKPPQALLTPFKNIIAQPLGVITEGADPDEDDSDAAYHSAESNGEGFIVNSPKAVAVSIDLSGSESGYFEAHEGESGRIPTEVESSNDTEEITHQSPPALSGAVEYPDRHHKATESVRTPEASKLGSAARSTLVFPPTAPKAMRAGGTVTISTHDYRMMQRKFRKAKEVLAAAAASASTNRGNREQFTNVPTNIPENDAEVYSHRGSTQDTNIEVPQLYYGGIPVPQQYIPYYPSHPSFHTVSSEQTGTGRYAEYTQAGSSYAPMLEEESAPDIGRDSEAEIGEGAIDEGGVKEGEADDGEVNESEIDEDEVDEGESLPRKVPLRTRSLEDLSRKSGLNW